MDGQHQQPLREDEYLEDGPHIHRWTKVNEPRQRGGWRAIHLACQEDPTDPHAEAVVQDLLRAGANPYLRLFRTGQTALHVACRHGQVRLVQRLVEFSVSPTNRALWSSSSGCHTNNNDGEIISLVHARDARGWNALHTACFYGNVAVVRYLLQQSDDPIHNVDAPAHDGSSALQLVAGRLAAAARPGRDGRRLQVLRLLVHLGRANVNRRCHFSSSNSQQCTPATKMTTCLHGAVARGDVSLACALLQCGATVDRELLVLAATRHDRWDVLPRLLQAAVAQGLLDRQRA